MEGTGGELDTFNLTPKSPRSRHASPHTHKSPVLITSTLSSKQLFQALKQSNPHQRESESLYELESKVFQLTNENAALTKGLDRLQDMLAKTKEDMEQAIQDLNEAHVQEIGQIQALIKEKEAQIGILNDNIDQMQGSLEYYQE